MPRRRQVLPRLSPHPRHRPPRKPPRRRPTTPQATTEAPETAPPTAEDPRAAGRRPGRPSRPQARPKLPYRFRRRLPPPRRARHRRHDRDGAHQRCCRWQSEGWCARGPRSAWSRCAGTDRQGMRRGFRPAREATGRRSPASPVTLQRTLLIRGGPVPTLLADHLSVTEV